MAINRQRSKSVFAGCEYGPPNAGYPNGSPRPPKRISAQSSVKWILFGTPRDATVGAEIAAALGDHCVNRVGQTTLEQLIDELRECCLLLTNDTGTMHLAALLGVPVRRTSAQQNPVSPVHLAMVTSSCDIMSNAAPLFTRMPD